MVPVNELPPPNLFATLGLGKAVILSDDVNAEDLSASDLGLSDAGSSDGAVGVASKPLSPAGFCAFARIAAISTFPTGSYAPFTVWGLSSFVFPDSWAWRRMAAISTLPIG